MTTADRIHAMNNGAQIVAGTAEAGSLRGQGAEILPTLSRIIEVLGEIKAEIEGRKAA